MEEPDPNYTFIENISDLDYSPTYKVAILGESTNIVAIEILNEALRNYSIDEVTFITTTMLPIWETWLNSEYKTHRKLKFMLRDNFDDLSDLAADIHYKAPVLKGYHMFFCTVATRQPYDNKNFFKSDYQHPLNFAEVAKGLKVPYFAILGSQCW